MQYFQLNSDLVADTSVVHRCFLNRLVIGDNRKAVNAKLLFNEAEIVMEQLMEYLKIIMANG